MRLVRLILAFWLALPAASALYVAQAMNGLPSYFWWRQALLFAIGIVCLALAVFVLVAAPERSRPSE